MSDAQRDGRWVTSPATGHRLWVESHESRRRASQARAREMIHEAEGRGFGALVPGDIRFMASEEFTTD